MWPSRTTSSRTTALIASASTPTPEDALAPGAVVLFGGR
jgi:hypothetical protein